jgi:hypothetical protein
MKVQVRGACSSTHGRDDVRIYRVMVRKSERKRPLGRHRRRLENNIKMDHKEIGWTCVDWI